MFCVYVIISKIYIRAGEYHGDLRPSEDIRPHYGKILAGALTVGVLVVPVHM